MKQGMKLTNFINLISFTGICVSVDEKVNDTSFLGVRRDLIVADWSVAIMFRRANHSLGVAPTPQVRLPSRLNLFDFEAS